MKCRKCLTTLASALIIAAAALALSGAATASTYKVIHKFELPKDPTGSLAIDAAGNLYGTTYMGGDTTVCTDPSGCGVVWKLARNPDGTWGTLTVLHKFTGGTDGAYPYAGLIFDAAGNLYGTTTDGGLNQCTGSFLGGCGIVFKLALNPDGTWTESVLYSFTGGADGANPYARLIFDTAGNLYGTAAGGGADDYGVVFKLAPNPDGTRTESVLYSFTGGADGTDPLFGLILDTAGNLYGATYGGGVVFKLASNPDGTWTETILYSFEGSYEPGVQGELIFDTFGNLYGTTGGVVFKLAPNPDGTWTESVLHTFTDGADGEGPAAGLIFDAAGNLYGTASAGGDAFPAPCHAPDEPSGCGVVFKLTPTSSGWSETVLHTFLGVAKYPVAPVLFDPKGNLYGTTSSGTGNNGTVFEITP